MAAYQDLLKIRSPKYWEDINYKENYDVEKRVFALIEVKPDSEEFEETKKIFSTSPEAKRFEIKKMLRIQHPFAYGSFLVNAVYKKATSSHEDVLFYSCSEAETLLIIETNFDTRISNDIIGWVDIFYKYAIIKEEINVPEDSSGAVRYPKYLLHLESDPTDPLFASMTRFKASFYLK